MRGIVDLLWNPGPLVLELCRKPLRRSSNKWPPGCWWNSAHPRTCAHASLTVCAATRANLLKCWERHHRRNTSICRHFARSRKLQKSVTLPSHGGGQGFKSPRVHSFFPLFAGKTSLLKETRYYYRPSLTTV